MLYKGEIPFVRLIIPLIAGISLGYVFVNEAAFNFAILLALFCLSVFALIIASYRKYSLYRVRSLVGLFVHFLIFLAAYGLVVDLSQRLDKTQFSLHRADALIALIKSEPKSSGSILRFESEIKGRYYQGKEGPATGKMMISIQQDSLKGRDFRYGDVILIPALYKPVDPPFNPGEFDYKSYLADRQIYHQSFLYQNQVYLIKSGDGNALISFALKLRRELVDKFSNYLPDKDAAAFASTLILGYRAELSRELVEAYSKTGTMHVLSVSGMHVGIVFMVLSWLLKFMEKTKRMLLIRALLIIAIIWFYALITGFSAPACRAALMLSFVVLGKALNRHQNTFNLIAVSAFFLLVYNPFYLFDAGFQLSYLAVIGLVYFHPRIYQSLYVKNKLLDSIWSYTALSLAAQLATFPLSIYYFHQFPLYFLFSNLFIVIPVAILMYAGILFMFIPGSVLLNYLGPALTWLIIFTNDILYYIENLPFSSWNGIWINAFECLLLGLFLIFMSLLISYRSKKLLFPVAFLVIILCLSFNLRWIANSKLHQLVFYNLRKNTAMAYIFDHRSLIVSDLDKADKLMSFSVLPAVKKKGSGQEVFHHTGDSFESEFYMGEPNFYQFGNYRILRWNNDFDHTTFSAVLKIDAVLLSGSPNAALTDLKACLNFTRLIIDSNNPDYKVKKWVSEAQTLNIMCDVLKNKEALVIEL